MKKLLTATALVTAGMTSSAFAETCYPTADIQFTNDEGVNTTVYAIVDEPINFERERSTGIYIHPEDAKNNAIAKTGRNLSINAMVAVVVNDRLRDQFGSEAGPGLTSHLVAPATLCVSEDVVKGLEKDASPVHDTGIKYQGDESKVSVWALKK